MRIVKTRAKRIANTEDNRDGLRRKMVAELRTARVRSRPKRSRCSLQRSTERHDNEFRLNRVDDRFRYRVSVRIYSTRGNDVRYRRRSGNNDDAALSETLTCTRAKYLYTHETAAGTESVGYKRTTVNNNETKITRRLRRTTTGTDTLKLADILCRSRLVALGVYSFSGRN